ncbi:response regulator [Rhizobium sp. RM]|uniref:response regulator n=1 Tax=Rhizobium sp. RM TaxID=2748079 RepID=UPI001FED32E6|nr:response regulator [Rhizobium sp. RM]
MADETRKALERLGALIVGTVTRAADAIELLKLKSVDAAILDVHLLEELVFRIAEQLENDEIPYVFATAYNPAIVLESFSGFILSGKPIDLDKIAFALFEPVRREH